MKYKMLSDVCEYRKERISVEKVNKNNLKITIFLQKTCFLIVLEL